MPLYNFSPKKCSPCLTTDFSWWVGFNVAVENSFYFSLSPLSLSLTIANPISDYCLRSYGQYVPVSLQTLAISLSLTVSVSLSLSLLVFLSMSCLVTFFFFLNCLAPIDNMFLFLLQTLAGGLDLTLQ